MAKHHVTTTINGEPVEFLCETQQTLLDVLRDEQAQAGGLGHGALGTHAHDGAGAALRVRQEAAPASSTRGTSEEVQMQRRAGQSRAGVAAQWHSE